VSIGTHSVDETFPIALPSMKFEGKTVRIDFQSSGEPKTLRDPVL